MCCTGRYTVFVCRVHNEVQSTIHHIGTITSRDPSSIQLPTGVTEDDGGGRGGRYKAQIKIGDKPLNLGRFDTVTEAQKAYEDKCHEIGRRVFTIAEQEEVGRSRYAKRRYSLLFPETHATATAQRAPDPSAAKTQPGHRSDGASLFLRKLPVGSKST